MWTQDRVSSLGNARFKHGLQNALGRIDAKTTKELRPALRDLAGWGSWISLVIRMPGSDLEPNGSLPGPPNSIIEPFDRILISRMTGENECPKDPARTA